MPNWCECDLVVRGPEADLAEFKKVAVGRTPIEDEEPVVLSEEPFVPYPVRFVAMDDQYAAWWRDNTVEGRPYGTLKDGLTFADAPKDGFNSGGAEWCVENWGTKWGICKPRITEETAKAKHSAARIDYSFECAWSPCKPVIEAMAKRFPTLEFELHYFECGVGYNGIFICKNGEVTMDVSGEYLGSRGG